MNVQERGSRGLTCQTGKGKHLVNVDQRITFDPADFGAGPGSRGKGSTHSVEGKAPPLGWTKRVWSWRLLVSQCLWFHNFKMEVLVTGHQESICALQTCLLNLLNGWRKWARTWPTQLPPLPPLELGVGGQCPQLAITKQKCLWSFVLEAKINVICILFHNSLCLLYKCA